MHQAPFFEFVCVFMERPEIHFHFYIPPLFESVAFEFFKALVAVLPAISAVLVLYQTFDGFGTIIGKPFLVSMFAEQLGESIFQCNADGSRIFFVLFHSITSSFLMVFIPLEICSALNV